ncbi:hypothetical protein MRB53_000371 [Persea americana]|uniref:Uncharacterized protein n=1 Tax=Persea americana TaxID=3435 RepID=A0ACC2MNZ3_PERAE|nr:hypothetical protein MRB53_000371 [Persea americana]
MKVKRSSLEVEGEGRERKDGVFGGTVVVGVKLDSQSRELLTWALVKVAEPGDQVVALHVLHNSEVLDQYGNSALLSLVKAFESVLAVYEGFCNLKQIDLKLKICRGSSVRKVLAREAKSFSATKVIVGITSNTRTIGSTTSIAKYCAKKLPLNCCVLAASNGKIIFQREAKELAFASPESGNNKENYPLPAKIFSALHRTLSNKNPNILSCRDSKNLLTVDGSLALVPVQTIEAASSSISLLMRELPELRPGWPLLRRAVLPERQPSERSTAKKISVVQWAMRLPTRHSTAAVHPDHKTMNRAVASLDGASGAIVPVGDVVSPKSDDMELKNLPKEFEFLHEMYSSTCRLFSYQELQSATSNFSKDNMIGKGGSSQVYKGQLPNGKELAVKILKPSEDAVKEFVSEIEIITTLHHKNIISLVGFCFDKNKLLLVYDCLPRGSLEENLHGAKAQTILSWDKRYKAAVGIAEALNYLHSSSTQSVIHRDVKSSNILLADDFEPQLSDFGLATWASASSSHIACTDVAGTFGYLAPEYFMYGKVNDKIDVYAFGVVLLELLSGRKPISNEYPKGQESLVMWAKPILLSGKVMQLLDPRLGDKYDKDQVEKIIMVASLCIRRSPRMRPRMSLISKLLHDEAIKWATLEAGASEELDGLDEESYPSSDIQSHLNVALLDVEDDSLSVSSTEPSLSYLTSTKCMEDYLQGRWSRSSSFD